MSELMTCLSDCSAKLSCPRESSREGVRYESGDPQVATDYLAIGGFAPQHSKVPVEDGFCAEPSRDGLTSESSGYGSENSHSEDEISVDRLIKRGRRKVKRQKKKKKRQARKSQRRNKAGNGPDPTSMEMMYLHYISMARDGRLYAELDDSESLVQEVFVRLYRNPSMLAKKYLPNRLWSRRHSWLERQIRRRGREVQPPEDFDPPIPACNTVEINDLLRYLSARLGWQRLSLLWEHCAIGAPIDELAHVYGRSCSAIKSELHQTKKKARKILSRLI